MEKANWQRTESENGLCWARMINAAHRPIDWGNGEYSKSAARCSTVIRIIQTSQARRLVQRVQPTPGQDN